MKKILGALGLLTAGLLTIGAVRALKIKLSKAKADGEQDKETITKPENGVDEPENGVDETENGVDETENGVDETDIDISIDQNLATDETVGASTPDANLTPNLDYNDCAKCTEQGVCGECKIPEGGGVCSDAPNCGACNAYKLFQRTAKDIEDSIANAEPSIGIFDDEDAAECLDMLTEPETDIGEEDEPCRGGCGDSNCPCSGTYENCEAGGCDHISTGDLDINDDCEGCSECNCSGICSCVECHCDKDNGTEPYEIDDTDLADLDDDDDIFPDYTDYTDDEPVDTEFDDDEYEQLSFEPEDPYLDLAEPEFEPSQSFDLDKQLEPEQPVKFKATPEFALDKQFETGETSEFKATPEFDLDKHLESDTISTFTDDDLDNLPKPVVQVDHNGVMLTILPTDYPSDAELSDLLDNSISTTTSELEPNFTDGVQVIAEQAGTLDTLVKNVDNKKPATKAKKPATKAKKTTTRAKKPANIDLVTELTGLVEKADK